MSAKFAEIILPLPLRGSYTYAVTGDAEVSVGSRVIVQFGPKKIYTGLVAKIHDSDVSQPGTKEILEVLDDQPIVNELQIKFFYWLSAYYMCSTGEVMNAAIPAGLKLSSESFVHLNPTSEWTGDPLNEKEETLILHLREHELSMKEIGALVGLRHPQSLVKSLAERNVIHLYEKVKDKYQPRHQRMVRIRETYLEEKTLEILFAELEKKPKQLDVLLTYLREVPVLEDPGRNERGIPRSRLAMDVSTSSLNTLVKKGVLEEWKQVVSRLPTVEESEVSIPELSDLQELARSRILSEFAKHTTVLLRGITGSGKTEIYVSLIHETIQKGKQVLYLLPEIALTTQIIQRLQRVFGSSFGVYHSQYSDNERVEVWQKVLSGDYDFVVGVRSSVFLPFKDLGLVIVDEEHEPSYKQFDPAPRYHARDAAIYLASLHNARVLLGTATPAIDTFWKSLEGKFGLVELDVRYGDVSLPEVELIDMRMVRKRKELKANLFSARILEAIGHSLEKGEQVILFQNRRGYAPFVSCEDCGNVIQCPHCDVSLTYHQFQNQLICHYCGYRIYMPPECPECGQKHLRHSGFGTEQIEEELQPFFPEAKIQRMDLDTTRSRNAYQRILSSFEEGEIDILVGTQMVSKGLDFDKVNLVGIFDIDRIIHFPDFRSHERAYQLITQVSGRSGRKSGRGQVLIQTHDPGHSVLQKVMKEDYRPFYQSEIMERESFQYPPFSRLIRVVVKHKDVQVANDAALYYANLVQQHLGSERLNGPADPVINRIRNLYLKEILIRLEPGLSLKGAKDLLLNLREETKAQKPYKSVTILFDVDPV